MHVRSIRRVVSLTLGELLGSLAITLGLLLVLNIGAILAQFNRAVPIDRSQFQQSLQHQLSAFSNNRLVNTATIVVFWSIIGLIVYTVFWMILNFATGVKNEVVVEADYVNKAAFSERIRVPVIKAGLGVLGLLYIAACMKVIFPVWVDFSRQFISNLDRLNPQIIMLGIVSLLGTWICVYLAFFLIKLISAITD